MLRVALILIAVAQAIIVHGPTSHHLVSRQDVALTDHSRWDPYAAERGTPHRRRILTSVFTPLDQDQRTCEVEIRPYLPPATAEIYSLVLESLEIPGFLIKGFEQETCIPSTAGKRKPLPVIIFSPGISLSRHLSSAQAQSLASQGYVVITIDHPYDATIVEFPDGEVVYGYNLTDYNPATAERAIKNILTAEQVRAADVSFLISQLPQLSISAAGPVESDHIFVYGHSLGGATAIQAALQDTRISGALNLDGYIHGSVADEGLDRPVFLVSRTPDEGNSADNLFGGFMDKLRGDRMLYTVADTKHLSFFDVPLLLALRDDVPASHLPQIRDALGAQDGIRLAKTADEGLGAAAEFVFKGITKKLCGLEKRFPDIEVLEQHIPCTS